MASDTVTLRMEGDIPLRQYASLVSGFDDLVELLTHEIAQGVPIDWALQELMALPDSAQTTAYGRSESREAVHSVAEGYLTIGRALERGSAIPYSPGVRQTVSRMRGELNGRVTSLVFETAESEATVRAAPVVGTRRTALTTKGAVSGRIQTVSSRGGLRFTLYDAVHDRAVSCYLAEGREDVVLEAWGKFAIVEGMVRRDPESGRAMSVRGITDVKVRLDGDRDAYLLARGAVPGPFHMSAEEAVRKLRDAQ